MPQEWNRPVTAKIKWSSCGLTDDAHSKTGTGGHILKARTVYTQDLWTKPEEHEKWRPDRNGGQIQFIVLRHCEKAAAAAAAAAALAFSMDKLAQNRANSHLVIQLNGYICLSSAGFASIIMYTALRRAGNNWVFTSMPAVTIMQQHRKLFAGSWFEC